MLQVWLHREKGEPAFVGHLDMTPPKHAVDTLTIPVAELGSVTVRADEADEIAEALVMHLAVPMKRRSVKVPEIVVMCGAEAVARELNKHRVPEKGWVEDRDILSGCRIYTWPVAWVDVEQYEQIFDFDIFVPLDEGEPDREALMSRKDFEREYLGKITETLSGKIAGMTVVDDPGPLTVEKLTEIAKDLPRASRLYDDWLTYTPKLPLPDDRPMPTRWFYETGLGALKPNPIIDTKSLLS